jgi:hypothetical protein
MLNSRDHRSMWMQDRCKVYMNSYMISNGSCFHGHLNYFQKPPLGGRPNTKPRDRRNPPAHNRWFILSYHVWEPTWIKIHWNSIWLRAQSHMTSHYTWGSVTTLNDFEGVLRQPLDTFCWALTISWSRLLTRVWSSPYCISNLLWFLLFCFNFGHSLGAWNLIVLTLPPLRTSRMQEQNAGIQGQKRGFLEFCIE